MPTYLVKGKRFSDARKAIDAAESAARRSRRPVLVSEIGYGGLHTVFPDGRVGQAWEMSRTAGRLPNRAKHMTKSQRKQRAKKTAAKTRIAKALRAFLQKQNPGMKLAGAAIQRLKGGVLKITPIKVNRSRGKRR
jgi:hypothetical protein